MKANKWAAPDYLDACTVLGLVWPSKVDCWTSAKKFHYNMKFALHALLNIHKIFIMVLMRSWINNYENTKYINFIVKILRCKPLKWSPQILIYLVNARNSAKGKPANTDGYLLTHSQESSPHKYQSCGGHRRLAFLWFVPAICEFLQCTMYCWLHTLPGLSKNTLN